MLRRTQLSRTAPARAWAAAVCGGVAALVVTSGCEGAAEVSFAAPGETEQPVVVWGAEQASSSSIEGCDGGAGGYGASVTLAPGTLLVGAPGACDGGAAAGAVVVFDRFGEQWVESDVIRRTEGGEGAGFGAAAAFSAPFLAVGAPGAERVEVLERSGWYFYSVESLGPPPGAPPASGPSGFGSALALDGRTLVAGAPSSSPGASEGGAAYVYRAGATGWTSAQILREAQPAAGARFGRLVAVSGNRVAVATLTEVFLFERDSVETELLLEDTLPIPDAEALLLEGDALAVVRAAGVVDFYALTDGVWSLAGTLDPAGAVTAAFALDRGQLAIATGDGVASFVQGEGAEGITSGWRDDGLIDESAPSAAAVDVGGGFVAVGDGAGGVFSYRRVASDGEPCSDGLSCLSGFCVDGVCCESACGGGEVDCLACSVAAGSSTNGRCEVAAPGAVCRPGVGACDRDEVCNGVSESCPPDALFPENTVCRSSSGACDVAEVCSGASPFCPRDEFLDVGVVCRAPRGSCDIAETCDGVRPTCPPDLTKPAGTECRARAGLCDQAEHCDGAQPMCPDDGFAPFGTVCRPRAGACDVDERCTGLAAACPTDAYAPDGTACADGDACTEGDQCLAGVCVSGPRDCAAPPPAEDAGPPALDDGGAPDSDGGDKRDPAPGEDDDGDDGGCGCSQGGGAPRSSLPAALGVGVVLWLTRRRRS